MEKMEDWKYSYVSFGLSFNYFIVGCELTSRLASAPKYTSNSILR